MSAFDTLITLAIIIKTIDIFVISYKKKNKEEAINRYTKKPERIKEKAIKEDTKKTDRIPLIIIGIIIIMLIDVAANNHEKIDPIPIQQINATSQTSQANAPTGIYIQPLLSATTGIMNQMGNEMVKNAERVQQEARRKVAKANQ